MDDDVMTTGLPSVAVAVHGDPAGDHVVSILQDGKSEQMRVGGHIGNAIAAHGLLARVIDLFRLAGGVTAANAAAAAPVADDDQSLEIPMPPAAPTEGAGSATDPAEPAATPGQGAAGDEKAADAG